jgi:DNA excision repair protein ERCC-1
MPEPQQPQPRRSQPQGQHGGNKRFRGGGGGGGGVSRGVVVASKVQEGNPVLKHVRQVSWRFGDVEPDFVVGATAAALYISVRYHMLHPGYLKARMAALAGKFRVRVLLVHVDVDDSQAALHSLDKLAFDQSWSLVCGWTVAEIARYIEAFKIYENRPADLIQGRTDEDYASKLASCLTAVRLVNKTDVTTLIGTFGTLRDIMTAAPNAIKLCPGIGELKATRLAEAFREPFRSASTVRPASPSDRRT